MTELIKKFIYKTFGQESYLKILHRLFFIAFDSGYLKKDPVYKYHYFVKRLIQSDDYVVDMGANLGYFSKIFARLTQNGGKVISIEPVKPFYKTLQWALKDFHNCSLYNYALGTEEKEIQMAVPNTCGYLRTGLASVSEKNIEEHKNFIFNVKMIKASTILSNLLRIDFIKCDIEGYEEFVLPELKQILIQHKPILQIETWGTHKPVVEQLMSELNYSKYSLHKNKLMKNLPDDLYNDYIFIHTTKENELINKLIKKGLA